MTGEQTQPYYPCVDRAIIRALRQPLRLAFLGTLIIFIDFTYGEQYHAGAGASGWQFDIIHDSFGFALVIAACGHLRRVPSPPRTRRFAMPIGIYAVFGTVFSFAHCLVGWQFGPLGVLSQLFELLGWFAILAFLWSIMAMCRAANCQDLVTYWRRAILAVVIVWLAPVTLLIGAAIVMRLAGGNPTMINIASPGPIFLGFLIFLIPVVIYLIAHVKTSGWAPPGQLTHCHICGYKVAGIPEPRCPECGTRFATERGSAQPGTNQSLDADSAT